MKKFVLILFCIAAFCLAVSAGEYEGYIVKFNETPIMLFSAEEDCIEEISAEDNLYLVYDEEYLQSLLKSGTVEYSEPNYCLELLGDVPSDRYYSYQWTLEAINYLSLYSFGYDASGVTVAVIDTGLDVYHEDFVDASISPYSKNFLGDGTHSADYFRDRRGHGTFVSSQIAAVTDNSIGLASVASGATLMVLRCMDSTEYVCDKYPYDSAYDKGATVSKLADAIEYAADNGADVINVSLGIGSKSTRLQDAVNYAADKGVIIVAAAGNDGDSSFKYPANCDNVIGVGSVSKSGETIVRSSFSQCNTSVDVSAPGGSVAGIYPFSESGKWYTEPAQTYWIDSGTSYASPVVAAAAAIAKQADDSLDGDGFLELLKQTVTDYGDAGYDVYYGYGVLNLDTLIKKLAGITEVFEGDVYESVAARAGDTRFSLIEVQSGKIWYEFADCGTVYRVDGDFLVEIPHTCENGTISFTADTDGIYAICEKSIVQYGDATADGEVALLDVLRTVRYITGENVVIDKAAADSSNDAVLDIKDVLNSIMIILNIKADNGFDVFIYIAEKVCYNYAERGII